jgi:hypothetical protein
MTSPTLRRSVSAWPVAIEVMISALAASGQGRRREAEGDTALAGAVVGLFRPSPLYFVVGTWNDSLPPLVMINNEALYPWPSGILMQLFPVFLIAFID